MNVELVLARLGGIFLITSLLEHSYEILQGLSQIFLVFMYFFPIHM